MTAFRADPTSSRYTPLNVAGITWLPSVDGFLGDANAPGGDRTRGKSRIGHACTSPRPQTGVLDQFGMLNHTKNDFQPVFEQRWTELHAVVSRRVRTITVLSIHRFQESAMILPQVKS